MIIALWLRLVVIIAFAVFVGFQEMWLLVGVSVLLVLVTAWQLKSAYSNRP